MFPSQKSFQIYSFLSLAWTFESRGKQNSKNKTPLSSQQPSWIFNFQPLVFSQPSRCLSSLLCSYISQWLSCGGQGVCRSALRSVLKERHASLYPESHRHQTSGTIHLQNLFMWEANKPGCPLICTWIQLSHPVVIKFPLVPISFLYHIVSTYPTASTGTSVQSMNSQREGLLIKRVPWCQPPIDFENDPDA